MCWGSGLVDLGNLDLNGANKFAPKKGAAPVSLAPTVAVSRSNAPVADYGFGPVSSAPMSIPNNDPFRDLGVHNQAARPVAAPMARGSVSGAGMAYGMPAAPMAPGMGAAGMGYGMPASGMGAMGAGGMGYGAARPGAQPGAAMGFASQPGGMGYSSQRYF
eukprot:TRINITY_DN6338_c0_g1_i4.p1 TRINITY_DN6338_c0_g1~~TRINITY_DN6338_c0_g1_i4.p1  ORF type:complete len:178 (-),score=78.23 TRINITY_DN6338_c0_g1_i4:180-662(-)